MNRDFTERARDLPALRYEDSRLSDAQREAIISLRQAERVDEKINWAKELGGIIVLSAGCLIIGFAIIATAVVYAMPGPVR